MKAALSIIALAALSVTAKAQPTSYPMQEGFVDANGVMIYYTALGHGAPLMIVHGGPGASHDYFLPYLLPLARHNRLIFIDERGSGKSQKLEDPKGYTVENMVEDCEAVRQSLNLGKMSLLGHSYGGALAQAYALKYQNNLSHLILCSTFCSTSKMNEVLQRELASSDPETQKTVHEMENAGLFGKGKPWEQNRYPVDYMVAAWGGAYFPYLYQRNPDPNFDPVAMGNTSWDLYREMWGSHGEFIIDGNLKSVEYANRLPGIHVPTLITAGDHDECDPALAHDMNNLIPGSKLVIFPKSGHMTFVDQNAMFIQAVDSFLH